MIKKTIARITEKGNKDTTSENDRSPFSRFDLIDKYSKDYTQVSVSMMDSSIEKAIGCDSTQSRYLSKRACKVWCLWLELYSKKIITLEFYEFFKIGADYKFITLDNCSLREEQKDVFELLRSQGFISPSLQCNFIEIHNLSRFQTYEIMSSWNGTIRIETEKDHFHSIPVYNMNGKIKLSDISYRGIRVDPWKYVTSNNFRYFTMFKEG